MTKSCKVFIDKSCCTAFAAIHNSTNIATTSATVVLDHLCQPTKLRVALLNVLIASKSLRLSSWMGSLCPHLPEQQCADLSSNRSSKAPQIDMQAAVTSRPGVQMLLKLLTSLGAPEVRVSSHSHQMCCSSAAAHVLYMYVHSMVAFLIPQHAPFA
jgi:hypothetical protein